MGGALIRVLRQPLDDYVAALTVFASEWTVGRVAGLGAALLATWWIYVPLHELAHAYGCILAGGSVSRLDIDPIYGAAWIQRVVPFVHIGSDYAGQLKGFDTHGSDLTYLVTDLLPFTATVLIGVPMLRAAGQPGRPPATRAILFGAGLPIAFAPFVSLTGDYYEMGSILVSRTAAALDPRIDVARWRSDDLFKLGETLFGTAGSGGGTDLAGLATSLVIGAALAFATYAAGSVWANALLGRELTR